MAGASRVSRYWHAAIAVVVVASLVIQLALLFAGGADANSGETGGGVGVATIGFHYVVPWATIIGWLVFGPRPRIDWETVLAAFAWPALWLVYIFTQGVFTDWYPYPFLDVSDIGVGAALRNVVFVVVLAAVLAVVFKLLDDRLPRTTASPAGDTASIQGHP